MPLAASYAFMYLSIERWIDLILMAYIFQSKASQPAMNI